VLGSATCLIAVLDGEQLRIANLGDCALVIVRRGQVVFRTEEMQHGVSLALRRNARRRVEYDPIRWLIWIVSCCSRRLQFNFPFQLGTDSRDGPMKDAQSFSVTVEKGDIVVMGSDGLSDNLVSLETARRDHRPVTYFPAHRIG
jgi:protein phosphatase PTC7